MSDVSTNQEKQMPIELGDKVKDQVTGFSGIVIARVEYLHGCIRFEVQPDKLLDGKPSESSQFDEPQLTLVSKAKVDVSERPTPEYKPPGGPKPALSKRPSVTRRS